MNNFKIYKIIALIALTLELAVAFVLFGKIKNLILDNNIIADEKTLLVLIIASIALATVLFILVFIVTGNKNEETLIEEIHFLDNDNTDSSIAEDEISESIDTEVYIKKIIPKESAKFDHVKYTEKLLSNFAKEFDIVQGLFFLKEKESDLFKNTGKYAYFGEEEPRDFKLGESLSGQVAKNKTILNLKDIPENYVTILSGLGSSSPKNLLIIPIIFNDETIGVFEFASFKEFEHKFNALFEKISDVLGKTLSKY
ncbi:MAG: GAF domain-containing protein [Bacteroidales bacterium]|nr:GAF domain-containing protein [Bacteroidales bacterium]